MIIEHDGVCYDTNNPQQNAELAAIYKDMYEGYAKEHSSLGMYSARLSAHLKAPSETGYEPTEAPDVLENAGSALGAPLVVVCLICAAIAALLYIFGFWSFETCVPVGNGLSFCF